MPYSSDHPPEDHEANLRHDWYQDHRWWDDAEDALMQIIDEGLLPGPAGFIDDCRIKDEYLDDGVWIRGRYWTGDADDDAEDAPGEWVEFRGELDITRIKYCQIKFTVEAK